ncbi:MAG: NUDIX hydrolase [Muribaculum sp.]|nr:NUDIX hydrolase [Muribaculaceae bacterium]MCM1080217.1 NUDIX hydrolase [Muribaculum sp.]
MSDYYSQHPRHYVAVDCIIFGLNNGRLSILLSHRAFEPEMGKWSLMGGFVGNDESVDEAAARVLAEHTGLDDIALQQVGAFGEIDRDPGERVISVAYCALVNVDQTNQQAIEAHNACWTPLDQLPELGFDHPKMIASAREWLCRQFLTRPIAFRLLPETFTLSQLQAICQVVIGEEIDKRNFRKRVSEIPSIEPTGIIDKSGSRRGAQLFRFNHKTYKSNPKFKL